MSAPSDSNSIPKSLGKSSHDEDLDLHSGVYKHTEPEAFIYLLAHDYSIQYSNGYFRKEFGKPDGSSHCYKLMRERKTPCMPCPARKVFKKNTEQVWIWEDTLRGKLYEVHDYPYLQDTGNLMVLGLGIKINEAQKNREPVSNGICYEDFLSICSHCKNINNNEGYRQRIEAYFTEKHDIQFSHGICPQCISKYYPTVFNPKTK